MAVRDSRGTGFQPVAFQRLEACATWRVTAHGHLAVARQGIRQDGRWDRFGQYQRSFDFLGVARDEAEPGRPEAKRNVQRLRLPARVRLNPQWVGGDTDQPGPFRSSRRPNMTSLPVEAQNAAGIEPPPEG